MRYAWDQFDAYFGAGRVGTMKSRLLRPMLGALSRWDAATAGRVDRYVAISQHVASRIKRYYNREAGVIYPPVDTGFYSPDDSVAPENFVLIVSALVPYKRIDVAIEASRLSGTPLRIVGDGPEREGLYRQISDLDQKFRGLIPGTFDCLEQLLEAADLLAAPGEHSVPPLAMLQSLAAGLPVVAADTPAAREVVAHQRTGRLHLPGDFKAIAAHISELFEQPAQAIALGAAARAEALSRPTPADEAAEYIALLRRLRPEH